MKTITIVSSIAQKKYVIETEATTMAELTSAMDEASINYQGSVMYEGLTKSEFDPAIGEAILPHDVPYKGTITNNLVFMITTPKKKIKSGSHYTDMRDVIKNNNLAGEFERVFSKNYTHGTTAEFEEFLSKTDVSSKKEKKTTVKEADEELYSAFSRLINLIRKRNLLDEEVLNKIICNEDTSDKEIKSPFTDKEIDEMFS